MNTHTEVEPHLLPLTPDGNVFEGFAAQAAAQPAAVAVIDQHGPLSYGDLAGRADAIAHHLLDLGLQPEQAVGVLMERRAELLAVLLGLWKAGGAYVPFDPADPVDRIRRMQFEAGVDWFIGDPDLLKALHDECDAAGTAPPKTIDISTIAAPGVGASTGAGPLHCAPGGSRLAYLLFTSGSTGEPKAVEVEHRQVLALLQSACGLLQFRSDDRYLAASTIAFDASITELFLPLVTGASLVLRDRRILLDPQRLASDVKQLGITVVQTGPSVWQVLLQEVPDFPRLRVAITHGEAVCPELAQRISRHGETTWNLYGPTETTVWATGAKLGGADDGSDDGGPSLASAPIGRPLPHVSAYVMDELGQPLADGSSGELYLGGPSVARGYRGHPQLTAQRFVELNGERLYRSGDVVLRDAQGVLQYLGRNDDQIKVRGVRVEPGEVEAALLRDERVSQAAVTWYTTHSGMRAIVAAVVMKPGQTGSAAAFHTLLSSTLPAPMIPARFLFVPWLPMTTSGKVDRLAIRSSVTTEPGPEPAAVVAEHLVPEHRDLTYTENAVALIWQRILGIPAVAPDDHFFSIGGDSLTAVQMIVETGARFGLTLPVHLAFEAPTLEQLAERVRRLLEDVESNLVTEFIYPLVPGEGRPIFFSGVELALARRGLWSVPGPLYAIVNWAKGAGFAHAKTLVELAVMHVAAMQRVQPHGPYRLAGFSLGGLLVYEMAQQLKRSGEEIEVLFLLDPMAPHFIVGSEHAAQPSPPPGAPVPTDTFTQQVKRHWKTFISGPGQMGFWQWLRHVLFLDRLIFVNWLHYRIVNHYLRHPNAASRALFPRDRWRAFWFAGQRLVKSYVATPYDGPVLAVFCQQGDRGAAWEALLGPDSKCHTLNSPHLTLFDQPTLGQWMKWLSDHLEELPGEE